MLLARSSRSPPHHAAPAHRGALAEMTLFMQKLPSVVSVTREAAAERADAPHSEPGSPPFGSSIHHSVKELARPSGANCTTQRLW